VALQVAALRIVGFLELPEGKALEQLARLVRHHFYGTGEAIIRQGEPGAELFLVRHGEVVVSLERDGHEEVEVARMGPGDFFGEMSLLTGEPRSATVRAGGPRSWSSARRRSARSLSSRPGWPIASPRSSPAGGPA
jgi:CRP-like cAMP-binding protein